MEEVQIYRETQTEMIKKKMWKKFYWRNTFAHVAFLYQIAIPTLQMYL